MTGQEALWTKLTAYSIMTLPKTLLLIGEEGCGKHLLSKNISEYYKLPLIEITNEITAEQLVEYQQDPIEKLYVINLDLFTDKQQNQFLKFIEEPTKTMHIILLACTELSILPTIVNRCFKYYFAPYTADQLRQITGETNELIYKICTTPGQIQTVNKQQIPAAFSMIAQFIQLLPTLTQAQITSFLTKINFKEEYNKIDYKLFLKILLYISYEKYLETDNTYFLSLYQFTSKYCQRLLYKTINKENFILNYLLNLKETLYGNSNPTR